MSRIVDYNALTVPVTKDQIAAFRAEAKAAGKPWASGDLVRVIVAIGALVVIGGMIVVFALAFMALAGASMASEPNPIALIGVIFPAMFLAAFAAIIIVGARRVLSGKNWEIWYRLDRFATANGMLFSPSDPNPTYPGAIFNRGDSRRAINHLRSTVGRFLDLGNYTYSTGSGKNRHTYSWGFMALHLDRKLPHMVLDSRSNNGLFGGTNLPAVFAKDQVLSLEGDFNEHFTLYCPRQYERDALYVFTPDLMALLIDEASPFDVEIVDDWMFVYSAAPFSPTSPAVYERLFRIVDTVGTKTLSQSDRYSDERVGSFAANTVAPQGQRLRGGVSIGALVAFAAISLFWVVPQLMTFFAGFSGLFTR